MVRPSRMDSHTHRFHSNKYPFIQTIILTIFLISTNFLTPTSCALTPSNLNANQPANYLLDLSDFTTPISAGSVVLITFPKEYSAYILQRNKPYTGNSVDDMCPDDCAAVAISYSAYTFVLDGMFPMTYTVFGIMNPQYKTKTGTFLIEIRTSDYATVQYSETVAGINFAA